MLFSYDIMYTVYIRLLCKYNTMLSEADCHIQIRINYMLGNKNNRKESMEHLCIGALTVGTKL